MYFPRTLERFFKMAMSQFPVLMLTGPRQVGKTTFLKHMSSKDRTYVTLDDPQIRDLARSDPVLFLQRYPTPLLIDEVQYAPELFSLIKVIVDRDKKPSLFWLTGSQQFSLMKNVTESLAGRVGLLQLLGLSSRETANEAATAKPFLPITSFIFQQFHTAPKLDLKGIYEQIFRGSFPHVALDKTIDRDFFYSSYMQTYLQRDVRDLTQVGDERAFLRFLRATAARTGQLLNLSGLARDADISPNTAKQWLSILQTSCLVYLLEPYHNNITKRFVKSPKLYFLDTGLCAYLTGWSSAETLEIGAMSGAFLETYVVSEIIKSYWHNGQIAPLYFYRDHDGVEVDLLIAQDNHLYPIEIKKTASPKKEDVRAISTLKNFSLGAGGLLCLRETPLPLSDSLTSIPISLL